MIVEQIIIEAIMVEQKMIIAVIIIIIIIIIMEVEGNISTIIGMAQINITIIMLHEEEDGKKEAIGAMQ